MNKNNLISILYTNHAEWCEMVKSNGIKDNYEDIVQDMYIRLITLNTSTEIIKNGKINKAYIWVTLRNICFSSIKVQKRFKEVNINEVSDIIDKDTSISKFNVKLDEEMDKWTWYDRTVFIQHQTTTVRKMAVKSGITLRSLCYTINACKTKIRKNLSEDYQEYLNNIN